MPEITLESLAARLTAVEAQLAAQQAAGPAPPVKDWRRTIGMFAGSEVMDEVYAWCAASRAAEREAARRGDEEEVMPCRIVKATTDPTAGLGEPRP